MKLFNVWTTRTLWPYWRVIIYVTICKWVMWCMYFRLCLIMTAMLIWPCLNITRHYDIPCMVSINELPWICMHVSSDCVSFHWTMIFNVGSHVYRMSYDLGLFLQHVIYRRIRVSFFSVGEVRESLGVCQWTHVYVHGSCATVLIEVLNTQPYLEKSRAQRPIMQNWDFRHPRWHSFLSPIDVEPSCQIHPLWGQCPYWRTASCLPSSGNNQRPYWHTASCLPSSGNS